MGAIDIPEILIGLGVVGCLIWAVYNRTHPHHGATR
jgi:hypothetical protein